MASSGARQHPVMASRMVAWISTARQRSITRINTIVGSFVVAWIEAMRRSVTAQETYPKTAAMPNMASIDCHGFSIRARTNAGTCTSARRLLTITA